MSVLVNFIARYYSNALELAVLK